MQQQQSQSESEDSPCQDVKTDGKFKWCSEAIHLLLKLRYDMAHVFANPPGKKILLWNEISEELKKNNYNVSGKLCFAKFRNLTASYRRRKELGDSYCHWEYMVVMDSFFNDHPSSFVLESCDNTLDQTYVSSTPEGTHSIYIVQNVDEEEMEQDGGEEEEEVGGGRLGGGGQEGVVGGGGVGGGEE
uniref:Myb/SANT-like DNA-binding domain-containing protein n=1 Tax=Cacopsylla melanoneura TaxID=428564 RepID=A0A8D8S4F2_9HEMI